MGYWIGRGSSGSVAFERIGSDSQRMWTVGFFRGIGSKDLFEQDEKVKLTDTGLYLFAFQ